MHKKYSTRHPIQFFCVMGILTLYPFFVLMNLSGTSQYLPSGLPILPLQAPNTSPPGSQYLHTPDNTGIFCYFKNLLEFVLPYKIFPCVLLNITGMIVPKSLVVVTFLAEAYEGLSFVFFLRLVIYLMGGERDISFFFLLPSFSLPFPSFLLLFSFL